MSESEPASVAARALADQLAEVGIDSRSCVVIGLRAGRIDELVHEALATLDAVVVDIDPSRGARDEGTRLRALEPTHVIADSLLYLAAARMPLRGYLRRRGFSVPDLRALAPVHVRTGRRWPLAVPRRAHSLDAMLAHVPVQLDDSAD